MNTLPLAPRFQSSLHNDAQSTIGYVQDLVAGGADLRQGWRYGILQTLDYCISGLNRGGVQLARRVFSREPQRTGSVELDAAYAALAEHLAERDGWPAPSWAADKSRIAPQPWIVAGTRWQRAVDDAWASVPEAFRRHNVIVSAHDLDRA
jgi:hypothetical protein